jgi:dTDP-4-dehydrorhamnose 3,5-epimerase
MGEEVLESRESQAGAVLRVAAEIDGVIVTPLNRHHDQRGWLMEWFRQDQLETDRFPAMAYVSLSAPGVVRGPHEHRHQTDLFCFPGFSTFMLFLWDNRPESTTFGKRMKMAIKEDTPMSVIVPPGVVHAYRNIGSIDGMVLNAPNRLYGGIDRAQPIDEIRYENDPNSPFTLD